MVCICAWVLEFRKKPFTNVSVCNFNFLDSIRCGTIFISNNYWCERVCVYFQQKNFMKNKRKKIKWKNSTEEKISNWQKSATCVRERGNDLTNSSMTPVEKCFMKFLLFQWNEMKREPMHGFSPPSKWFRDYHAAFDGETFRWRRRRNKTRQLRILWQLKTVQCQTTSVP